MTAGEKDLAGRRIVVTGANGFVGRATCRGLVRRGASVVACVRRAAARDVLPHGVERTVVANVHDRRCWKAVVERADAVVHLVARTHVTRDGPEALPEYRRTNVEITRTILAAALAARVPRFVYASSIKAVGEGSPQPYDESSACRPRDAYGITKREAELLVQGECWGSGTEAVIVRPPLVYGPGVGGNFARLIRAVDRGLPLPLGRIEAPRSLVHVDNLAAALVASATHPYAGGRTFHVADDGEPPAVRELVARIAALLGRPVRLLPVPRTMLRVAGHLLRRTALVERLTDPLVVTSREIRSRLGWRAPVDAAAGLRETIEWYRQRGLEPVPKRRAA